MYKDVKVSQLFVEVCKITDHAKKLTLKELEDLAAGDGWITLIKEETQFAKWLDELNPELNYFITESILREINSIYLMKKDGYEV